MDEVDVEPLGGANHSDWQYTESRGWGSYTELQRNQPEDLTITIRACLTEGSTHLVACGPWMDGQT